MRRWFWLLVPLAACQVGTTNSDDGGQFGEESGAHCEAVSRTALAVDEESSLGFAPQAVLDLAGGSTTSTLTYADGSTASLAEDVEPTGVMELVHYEVVDDATGTGAEPALSVWCPDQVELEVTVGLVTDDGVLDEHVDTRLTAAAADDVRATFDLDHPSGTFDPWDYAPTGNDYDDLRAWVELAWDASGPSGVVQGQGSGTDGEVAFAESVDIATWGPTSE